MRTFKATRFLVFAFAVLMVSATAFSQVSIAIRIGPPVLPVYEQPVCPGEGYIWTPGYWAYDYDVNDYYWVPGTWVLAPEPGYLWTPGYWGWAGDRFIFHEGYWGPRVGFYGGINYGFGYFGNGYEGGRWDHDRFFYNRSVNNINIVNIHNVYNTTIVHETVVNRVSYNGGNGGINMHPTHEQEEIEHERHVAPVPAQVQHMQAARGDREQRASVNHGRPNVAASPKPGEFHEGAIPSKEGEQNYVPRPGNTPIHPKDLPQRERPAPPNTGNAKFDQKYKQQQDKMYAKQDQDRQRLQQKQDNEHQKLDRQKADDSRRQQVEQKHQQQTQKLEQKHEQQQQKLESKQQPRGHK